MKNERRSSGQGINAFLQYDDISPDVEDGERDVQTQCNCKNVVKTTVSHF